MFIVWVWVRGLLCWNKFVWFLSEETPGNEETSQTDAAPAATADVQQQPKQAKKSMKLTYEEYKQLANLLVFYMRRKEEQAAGGMEQLLNVPVLEYQI